MRLRSVFKMRTSILNTATTEQMEYGIISFFVCFPLMNQIVICKISILCYQNILLYIYTQVHRIVSFPLDFQSGALPYNVRGNLLHLCISSFFFYFPINYFSEYTGYDLYIFWNIFQNTFTVFF